MIKELSMEECLKDVNEKDNKYLGQFAFIEICGDGYEGLRVLFDDYDLGLDKFNHGLNDYNFIDFGYIPF